MRVRALGLAGLAVLAGCGEGPAQEVAAPASPAAATATPDAAGSVAAALSASCAAGEEPVFSCKFRDGKRVAVCGIAPGKAEYRFGGDGKTELVLSGGRNAYQMYSGGGESQLAFDNGDTRYIVFSRMVRTGFGEDGNMPAISDGVVVERAGKFVSIRTCDDPDVLPVQTDAAGRFLTPADDHFTDETMRADPFGNG